MYCKNCGKTIEDNSTFCPYCGTNQGTAPTGYYDQRKNIRQSELAAINSMVAYFSPKEQQYAEYFRLDKVLSQADIELALKPKAPIVLGSIALVFFIFSIWAAIGKATGWRDFCLVVGCLITFLALIFAGVYVINRVFWKKQQEKSTASFQALDDELSNHYDAYGYCPLGFEQTVPDNLRDIRDAIVSGYADSITDAVNYLAQRSHNETMERNAVATAKSAKKAAGYAAASFFLKK